MSCGILSTGKLADVHILGRIETYQVVEGQVGQVGRLVHTQILEGLGRGVDLLVMEFPLDLIGRRGVPPQVLVKVVGEGLQNRLGEVEVAALLDNLTVHQLGDLGSRVVLGAVELVGLTNRALVVQHQLQSSANIDGLG